LTDPAAVRRRLIARRRWSIFCAAGVGATTIGGLFTLWPEALGWILRLHWMTLVCVLVPPVAMVINGVVRRGGAFWGLKHLLEFPPIWLAGVLGALALSSGVAFSDSLRMLLQLSNDVGVPMTSCVVASAIVMTYTLGALYWVARCTGCAPGPFFAEVRQDLPAASAADDWDWERLHAWLLTDDAIKKPADDLFGYETKARRIARRLCEAEMPAQAVVGRLGAGKSTLRHLVEYELSRQHSRTHLVVVELWPYNTPEAAVEGVLRTLLDRVGQEVETLGIRGLPDEYRSAMGSAHAVGATLAGLLGKASNPFDVLDCIDNVARAVDHRFVVWIEDLERFAASKDRGERLEHSLRLAPLRALLFGLTERHSLTVVTATTSLHARFDVEKIARYVEELPVLEPGQTVKIIRAVRRHCLTFAIVNPSAGHAQRDWEAFDSDLAIDLAAAFGRKTLSIPTATILLCRTPRTLKQGLRRVLDFWGKYAGEIDFDDLFLMSLLREAEPSAFALIRDHWDEIAGVKRDEKVRKQARENFERRLTRLRLSDSRHLAVTTIVKAVFDAEHPMQKLQSLRELRYWLRFTSEPEIEREDSDQLVLRTLLEGDDERVLDLLEGPQRQIVVRFSKMLSGKRLLTLFDKLVLRRVPEDPGPWFVEGEWISGHPPGMIPIWHMIGNQWRPDLPTSTEIAEHVMGAFEVAIGNLHLVHELEHYFCSSKTHEGPINRDGSEESNRLVAQTRTRLWELLVEHYAGNPSRLPLALKSARLCALEYLVWGSLRMAQKQMNEVPFPNWDQLATAILDAAWLDPVVVLPQLANLVCDSLTTFEGQRHVFNADRAGLLFGDEARVLELFRNPPTVASDAEPFVSAVRAAAAQHFAEQATPPAP
jgi:hypothetical protein